MRMCFKASWRVLATAAALALFQQPAAWAQDVKPAAPAGAPARAAESKPTEQRPVQRPERRPVDRSGPVSAGGDLRHLPPDSVTKHTLALPGRTLSFTATAGSITLYNSKSGEANAAIAYTAYELDGADPRTRPVTFVFNGGPGSASAWLQLGNVGPWRLPMTGDAVSPSAPPDLLPNAETWLDFTDLVFIDPVDTGYSRFINTSDDVRHAFLSVDGDISSIAVTIRRWLEKSDRLVSPKFILGESYGGFRGPRVTHALQSGQGIGVNGLIMISPVLDFREFQGSSIMQYVAALPSMAAVAREAKMPTTRADMADVESYAAGDFLVDLLKGQADPAALDRVSDKVAGLIGIDRAFVRRLAGAVPAIAFRRESDRRDGKVLSGYDGTFAGFDPNPDAYFTHAGEPLTSALNAPVTSAMVDLYEHQLNWRPDGHYELISDQVNRDWRWGRGLDPPESMTQLREALALDPKLKVIVAHGLFDLVTPYFGSKMQLDQLPTFGSRDRVRLIVLPGGHMFYMRDPSRVAIRGEAKALMGAK